MSNGVERRLQLKIIGTVNDRVGQRDLDFVNGVNARSQSNKFLQFCLRRSVGRNIIGNSEIVGCAFVNFSEWQSGTRLAIPAERNYPSAGTFSGVDYSNFRQGPRSVYLRGGPKQVQTVIFVQFGLKRCTGSGLTAGANHCQQERDIYAAILHHCPPESRSQCISFFTRFGPQNRQSPSEIPVDNARARTHPHPSPLPQAAGAG